MDILGVKTRVYDAANAYGRYVKVTERRFQVCGVLFVNRRLPYIFGVMRSTSSDYNLGTSIADVSPQEAKVLRDSMSMLYIGVLTSPYHTAYLASPKAPTIDSPTAASWTGDALVLDLKQVWFWSSASGKIYLSKKS